MDRQTMTKHELAEVCGVSRNTMGRWFRLMEPHLRRMGYTRATRRLSPQMVAFVYDWLCL